MDSQVSDFLCLFHFTYFVQLSYFGKLDFVYEVMDFVYEVMDFVYDFIIIVNNNNNSKLVYDLVTPAIFKKKLPRYLTDVDL